MSAFLHGGRMLKAARMAQGLSLQAMAERLGMTKSGVYWLERIGNTQLDTFSSVAAACDITVLELFKRHWKDGNIP